MKNKDWERAGGGGRWLNREGGLIWKGGLIENLRYSNFGVVIVA